jgi:hypothetical protein
VPLRSSKISAEGVEKGYALRYKRTSMLRWAPRKKELIMAARVIHFGPDDCHRLMVLRSAGYAVDGCMSLAQLRASLLGGRAADAVLMSDGDRFAPESAAALAKSCSSAPVVLFSGTNRAYEDAAFDLVVHSLTPPEVWLHEVDALIAKSRVLGRSLAVLSRKSAQLREESALVVNKSRSDRIRSRRERARNAGPPSGNRPGPDSRPDSALK